MSKSILTTYCGEPATLTAEHALLLGEVTKRTTDLVNETDQNRWPQAELKRLLDYLHLEVLRQAVDEEWLLFRQFHDDPENLIQLRQEHLELRRVVSLLADTAGARQRSPQRLSETARLVLTTLRDHLQHESRILGAGAEAPSTSAMGQTPHTWFALVSCPLVNLDLLPGRHGVDAVLARLLRLREGEAVQLESSSDLAPVRGRLSLADPGGYGFTVLQQGPPRWRLDIARRPAH